MKLRSGDFETGVDEDGEFYMRVCTGEYHTSDGGWTHEEVVVMQYLDKVEARVLIDELLEYLCLTPI